MSFTNTVQSNVLPEGQCGHGEWASKPARQLALTRSSITDSKLVYPCTCRPRMRGMRGTKAARCAEICAETRCAQGCAERISKAAPKAARNGFRAMRESTRGTRCAGCAECSEGCAERNAQDARKDARKGARDGTRKMRGMVMANPRQHVHEYSNLLTTAPRCRPGPPTRTAPGGRGRRCTPAPSRRARRGLGGRAQPRSTARG